MPGYIGAQHVGDSSPPPAGRKSNSALQLQFLRNYPTMHLEGVKLVQHTSPIKANYKFHTNFIHTSQGNNSKISLAFSDTSATTIQQG
jgi:hypothetical protein